MNSRDRKNNYLRRVQMELKKGARGHEVSEMKADLNRFGFKLDIKNDYFWTLTESAVKSWQKSHGLEDDGWFGPKSKAKMKEAIKELDEDEDINKTENLTPLGRVV